MARSDSLPEFLREKHRLQAEIARQRRQIDRHLRAVGGEARRLTSWRTYVERFPAPILLAAFGVGVVAGAGRKTASWRCELGRWIMAAGMQRAQSLAWGDVLAAWSTLRKSWSSKRPSDG